MRPSGGGPKSLHSSFPTAVPVAVGNTSRAMDEPGRVLEPAPSWRCDLQQLSLAQIFFPFVMKLALKHGSQFISGISQQCNCALFHWRDRLLCACLWMPSEYCGSRAGTSSYPDSFMLWWKTDTKLMFIINPQTVVYYYYSREMFPLTRAIQGWILCESFWQQPIKTFPAMAAGINLHNRHSSCHRSWVGHKLLEEKKVSRDKPIKGTAAVQPELHTEWF